MPATVKDDVAPDPAYVSFLSEITVMGGAERGTHRVYQPGRAPVGFEVPSFFTLIQEYPTLCSVLAASTHG